MERIDRLRNDLSRIATEIYKCKNPVEREQLIKQADDIVGKISPEDAMIFFQWRHYGIA
ncbi:MAG: hypothetical protein M0022_02100 [Desulfobacteraceae bacterium]|nr:hypothetical protein [Desulfobacteraceae bacterium]